MDKPAETLGQEILRLRTLEGLTLRRFAELIGVSAAYVSDIEHDRRRPSEDVLRRMAQVLKHAGATFEGLDRLNSRLDRDLQKFVAETPAIRQMLREIKRSGQDPREIIRQLQERRFKKGKQE